MLTGTFTAPANAFWVPCALMNWDQTGKRAAVIGATSRTPVVVASPAAPRAASELGSELGDIVGFKIRFNDKVKRTSAIKFMTDGILLAEIQSDPLLRGYDTIIVDEAHERSLNIDFLLGFLKRLLPRRPDLRVIVSSATLEIGIQSAP